MRKDEARAILIANLKGPRRKRLPLTTIARAVRQLLNNEYGGSARRLAKDYDVSRPIIESFDKILDHPPEIRKLISQGKLLLDASTKLSTIPDNRKRIELARVISGMSAFDARYVIDYWKKNPHLSAETCKKIVLESKTVERPIHLVGVALDDELFNALSKEALRRRLSRDDAIKMAIQQWLNITQNKG
jgi:hypothetical protein